MSYNTLKAKVELLIEKAKSGGIQYTDIICNDDDTVTLIDTNGIEHTITCVYENNRLTSMTYDGKEVVTVYDFGKLVAVGETEVDVANAPLDNTIEALIDKSGVLDSTDGTVEKKVEMLVDRTDLFIKQSAINFSGNKEITDIDFYIETPYRSFDNAFASTTNLKHIVGINTSKSTNNRLIFANSGVEIIDMPFDFSAQPSSSNFSPFDSANKLVEVRIVPNTYKWTSSIHSAVLSGDSIQSIVDGLATVSTSQSIRFNSAVIAKLTDEQKATISSKGWTLVQL